MTDEPACPTPCDDDCDASCHEWHEVFAKRSHVADSCQRPEGPEWAVWAQDYGIRFQDGSVMHPWNGRTQEQRARERLAELQAKYPRDRFVLVVRGLGNDQPWKEVDGVGQRPGLSMRHCRYLGVHIPHDYERRGDWFACPGIRHDHTVRCCDEHRHHVSPHVGCILR